MIVVRQRLCALRVRHSPAAGIDWIHSKEKAAGEPAAFPLSHRIGRYYLPAVVGRWRRPKQRLPRQRPWPARRRRLLLGSVGSVVGIVMLPAAAAASAEVPAALAAAAAASAEAWAASAAAASPVAAALSAACWASVSGVGSVGGRVGSLLLVGARGQGQAQSQGEQRLVDRHDSVFLVVEVWQRATARR